MPINFFNAYGHSNHCLTMVEVIGEHVEFIYCYCNCGFTRPKYDKRGRECKYINGHFWKGRKLLEETKQKMRLKQCCENNPGWKGDNIGIKTLHQWVRRHFWPTKLCQMCLFGPPYDLANITGIYNREFKNWRYFCRKCHMESDERLKNLHQFRLIDMSNRICLLCGLKTTYIKKDRYHYWYKYLDGHICASCYKKKYSESKRCK